MSDKPVAETSTWQHRTHKRQTSMSLGVSNPLSQQTNGWGM